MSLKSHNFALYLTFSNSPTWKPLFSSKNGFKLQYFCRHLKYHLSICWERVSANRTTNLEKLKVFFVCLWKPLVFKIFIVTVIEETYPLGNPMLIEFVWRVTFNPELTENKPEVSLIYNLPSKNKTTTKRYSRQVFIRCCRWTVILSLFPRFAKSSSDPIVFTFSLGLTIWPYKYVTICPFLIEIMISSYISPLTGSFILFHATYNETRRAKGCLIRRIIQVRIP